MGFDKESSDSDYLPNSQYDREPTPAPSEEKKVAVNFCDVCKKSFSRKDSYDRHMFTHTGLKSFDCPEEGCDKKYSNSAHLKRHVRTNHQERKPVEHFINCKHPTCKRLFKTESSMLRHHQNLHVVGKPYSCTECPETFRRKLQVKMHMYHHTGEYPHKCDKCGKGFMNERTFRSHKQAHLPYKCEHCPKLFEHWTDLVAHRKIEHLAEHKCEQCDKLFYNKRHLKDHLKTHQTKDEREVLQCPHDKCPRYYFYKQNLNAHIRSKHEGSKKFICEVPNCLRQLSTRQKLIQHQKLHRSATKNVEIMKKPAQRRKDAGVQKKSTASTLARVDLNPEIEQKIIIGEGKDLILDPLCLLDSTSDSEMESGDRVGQILKLQLQNVQKEIDKLLNN